MGEHSKIEWTDHTFNPWMGCARVSEGCRHCYAEEMMDHRLCLILVSIRLFMLILRGGMHLQEQRHRVELSKQNIPR